MRPRTSRRPVRGRSGRGGLAAISALLAQAVRFSRPLMGLIALVIVIVAYNKLTGSELFQLHHVEVSGVSPQLQSEIEQAVKKAVGSTRVLEIDLAGIRQKIEALPRVRTAWVMRALPDSIRVEAAEREAAVLARRHSGDLAWLDSDAVDIGALTSVKLPSGIPPVVKGFSEGPRTQLAIADDRERIAVYRQLEEDFSREPGSIWSLIDEIDLSLPKDVDIHLIRPPVLVHIGSREFRNRAEAALKIADAIRRGDAAMLGRLRVQDAETVARNQNQVSFIDAARSDGVVLSFAGPEAAKDSKQDSQVRSAPANKR